MLFSYNFRQNNTCTACHSDKKVIILNAVRCDSFNGFSFFFHVHINIILGGHVNVFMPQQFGSGLNGHTLFTEVRTECVAVYQKGYIQTLILYKMGFLVKFRL